jgi:hypothetical protein
MTSTAASIVAAVHIPDPTEAGLLKMPLRPRQRGYRQLQAQHSYGIHIHGHNLYSLFFAEQSLSEMKRMPFIILLSSLIQYRKLHRNGALYYWLVISYLCEISLIGISQWLSRLESIHLELFMVTDQTREEVTALIFATTGVLSTLSYHSNASTVRLCVTALSLVKMGTWN